MRDFFILCKFVNMRISFLACLAAFFGFCQVDLQAQSAVVHSHSNFNIPSWVEFQGDEKPDFASWEKVISKIANSSSATNWKIYNTLTDDLGQKHYRIQQYYNRIPLETGVSVLHTQNDKILSWNGEIIPEKLLQGQASLNAEQAREKALSFMPAELYYWQSEGQNHILEHMTGVEDTTWFPTGSLVYCPVNLDYTKKHLLAWKFDIRAEQPLKGSMVYVDAATGEIIATEDLILHTDVKGTAITAFSSTKPITTDSTAPGNYRLREKGRGKGIETFNMQKGTSYGAAVDFTDADNYWNNVNANKDEIATDAHWGAEKTYDYFDSLHGRNSFDGNGAKIISYVHYSNNYSNAFWNGSYMTYGDGNGSTWKPLTSIDVCGHEISHAVTTYSAGLIYSYESGALNESFSDIFGNAIERWARPNKYNWKMGEDFTTSGAGIRDMSNPNPYNNPKYYKGSKWYFGTGDNGGVHYNSGVQNYWFYLITDGISGTNEVGNNFDIDSLGLIDASKIAYRNLTVYLTKNSQYSDARTYSIKSAADLFGQCSKHVIAVTNAWWACGVGAKYDSGYVKANFTGDTMACYSKDSVSFTNLSTNYISCKWYFGDGGTSTAFNPKHAYSGNGTYTVKLVANSCFKSKTDSITRINYVKVDSTFDICDAVLMPFKGTDSAYKCKGFIYDDGGEGMYGALKQVNLKVIIPAADSIRLRFLVLDYENGYDSIVLYKTNTLQANKIGRFTGSALPFGGAWITVNANSLWLRQYSDPLVEGKGFKIEFEGFRKPLYLNLGADTTICMGDSVSLIPNLNGGYAPNYLYSWSSGENTPNIKLAPVAPQTQIKLNVKDACTEKSVSDSIVIFVRPELNVSLAPDTIVCNGNPVTMQAIASGGLNTAYSYTWNQGLGNAATHVVTPLSTVNYRVILSDACTNIPDTAYRTVYVKPALKAKISASDTLVCIGKNVVLNVASSGGDTAGYAHTWNQGLGSGSTKTITLNDSGWYKVTLTDGCSKNAASDSIRLFTYPPLLIGMPSDTIICRGSAVGLDAKSSGGKGIGYTFLWNTGETTNGITKSPSSPSYFRVTLSDGCSPSVLDSVFVDLYVPLALSSQADTTLCDGQSLPLSLTSSGGLIANHAIVWNIAGVSGNSPILTPPTGKTNYVAVLSDGCTKINDTTKFSVTMLPPLVADISVTPPAICAGDSITLKFVITGGKPAQYNWTLDGNPVSFTSVRLQPSVNTTYTLNVVDGCSVPSTDMAGVTISPAATATLNVDNKLICANDQVLFSYSSPDAATVKWFFSTGDSASGTGMILPKIFPGSGKFSAKARVVTSMGCSAVIQLFDTVTAVAYPVAGFTANPQVTNIENPLITFVNKASGGSSFNWSFGDGNVSTVAGDVTHSYTDTGWFLARQIVTINPGCSDTFDATIRVKDVYRLYMPSSFTPDENGLNDYYMPSGRGIQSFKMSVYNRWGEKVFETTDMKNKWSGADKEGHAWAPDMYAVLIEIIDTEGYRHVEKGTVLLIR